MLSKMDDLIDSALELASEPSSTLPHVPNLGIKTIPLLSRIQLKWLNKDSHHFPFLYDLASDFNDKISKVDFRNAPGTLDQHVQILEDTLLFLEGLLESSDNVDERRSEFKSLVCDSWSNVLEMNSASIPSFVPTTGKQTIFNTSREKLASNAAKYILVTTNILLWNFIYTLVLPTTSEESPSKSSVTTFLQPLVAVLAQSASGVADTAASLLVQSIWNTNSGKLVLLYFIAAYAAGMGVTIMNLLEKWNKVKPSREKDEAWESMARDFLQNRRDPNVAKWLESLDNDEKAKFYKFCKDVAEKEKKANEGALDHFLCIVLLFIIPATLTYLTYKAEVSTYKFSRHFSVFGNRYVHPSTVVHGTYPILLHHYTGDQYIRTLLDNIPIPGLQLLAKMYNIAEERQESQPHRVTRARARGRSPARR